MQSYCPPRDRTLPHTAYLALFLLGSILSGIFQPLGAAPAGEEGHHHHHDREYGAGIGWIAMDPEEETAAGVHVHFMSRLGEEGLAGYLGLGLGFEAILATEMHYNPMLSLGIFPYGDLRLTLSPGVQIARHEGEMEYYYSTHIELSYGFFYRGLEIGPVIGYAHSAEDKHYMVGIHFGRPF